MVRPFERHVQIVYIITKMSENFLRVKRDILRDMKETSQHTQESWANIMLKHTQYLETVEDQNSFWNFILNPTDERGYVNPTFTTYNSDDVVVESIQKLSVYDKDDEKSGPIEITLENEKQRDGLTMYIKTKQVV